MSGEDTWGVNFFTPDVRLTPFDFGRVTHESRPMLSLYLLFPLLLFYYFILIIISVFLSITLNDFEQRLKATMTMHEFRPILVDSFYNVVNNVINIVSAIHSYIATLLALRSFKATGSC